MPAFSEDEQFIYRAANNHESNGQNKECGGKPMVLGRKPHHASEKPAAKTGNDTAPGFQATRAGYLKAHVVDCPTDMPKEKQGSKTSYSNPKPEWHKQCPDMMK